MAPINGNDVVAKVDVAWGGPGTAYAHNILYMAHGDLGSNGPWSGPDMEEFLLAWKDFEDGAAGLTGMVNHSWALNSVTMSSPPTESDLERTLSFGIPGGSSGDPCAPNLATLVRLRGSEGGRASRGRMYLPARDEEDVDGAGNYDPTFTTALQGIMVDWVEALPTFLAGVSLGILSRYDGVTSEGQPIPRPTPLFYDLATIEVDSKTATQRRRLRR